MTTTVSIIVPVSATAVAAPYGAAGPLVAGTSTTPNAIDTGSIKTFTIAEYNRSFFPGTRLRMTAVGFADTWLEGIVTAWDGEIVSIDGDLASGTGTYSDWQINVAGEPGQQGPIGATGPTGPSGGPAGPQGPAGTPGSVWRNGSGAPLNSLGVNGDYYLDDLTDNVYLRTASVYSIVANIGGAAGATGPAGPTGPTGPQGIIAEAPTDGAYYARRNAAWAVSPAGGGGASVSISPTPPSSPSVGNLWWDSTGGQLYIYYDDATSQQWVVTVNTGVANVLITGAPVAGQWAQWTDGTHIQGQTPTQVTATLDVFTTSLKGLVPASGGGTTNFLRADGTFAAVPVPTATIPKITTFTASGTYTPTAGLIYAIIECVGGGGGGGGGQSPGAGAGYAIGCGGGGSGGYSRTVKSAAQIGASQSVTIGAGGAGVSNANGNAGGTTSVGTLCVAQGGSGGTGGGGYFAAGAGGVIAGAVGDVIAAGAPGVNGMLSGDVATGTRSESGAGGSSFYGGGGVGIGTGAGTAINGNAASSYGSGGGGGGSYNVGTSFSGGNGSAGVVIITEYF
jgi:hypothetical protein